MHDLVNRHTVYTYNGTAGGRVGKRVRSQTRLVEWDSFCTFSISRGEAEMAICRYWDPAQGRMCIPSIQYQAWCGIYTSQTEDSVRYHLEEWSVARVTFFSGQLLHTMKIKNRKNEIAITICGILCGCFALIPVAWCGCGCGCCMPVSLHMRGSLFYILHLFVIIAISLFFTFYGRFF